MDKLRISGRAKILRWTTQIPSVWSATNKAPNKVTNTKCHIQKDQDYSVTTSLFLSIENVGNEVQSKQWH